MTITSRLAGLILAALPLAAAGCATPEPVVRLQSMATNATWIAGRSVEAKEMGGVRVAAAFDHQDAGRIAFRVEFANGSDHPIDIGPDAMTFNRCEKDWGTEIMVADPEEAIADLDAAGARERARAENDSLALAPLLFLSVVGDVATVATGKTSSTTGLQSAALADRMDHREARHANAVQALGAEKQVWMDAALRRTVVPPGGVASGLVFIPTRTKARFVRLNVWAGKLAFTFLFKQQVRPA